VLVLAFDVRTPISKIHSQAGELARALASSSEPELPQGSLAVGAAGKQVDSPGKPVQISDSAKPPVQSQAADAPSPEVVTLGKQDSVTPEAPSPPPIAPLPLDDIPPPTPPEYKGELPKLEDMQWPWELDPELDDQDEEVGESPRQRKAPAGDVGAAARMRPVDKAPPSDEERAEAISETAGAGRFSYPFPEELHPVSKMILSSPVVYVIHYACVLLPRMPEHQLRGDLPVLLSRWMRQISLVSGWRLELVTVHSDYLHWIAGVAPEAPAVEVIHLVRQQTSAWIFAECPAYARDNPSNDFWAPGFLVVTGSRPLPPQLISEYIKQTRIRQGVAGET
jgi:hypothetical protein